MEKPPLTYMQMLLPFTFFVLFGVCLPFRVPDLVADIGGNLVVCSFAYLLAVQIAGIAAYQLVRRKRFSWDESAAKYFYELVLFSLMVSAITLTGAYMKSSPQLAAAAVSAAEE